MPSTKKRAPKPGSKSRAVPFSAKGALHPDTVPWRILQSAVGKIPPRHHDLRDGAERLVTRLKAAQNRWTPYGAGSLGFETARYANQTAELVNEQLIRGGAAIRIYRVRDDFAVCAAYYAR